MAESNNLTERKRVRLKCTPSNPIFLMWLNSLGGWSYWCFSGSSKVAKKIKRLDDFLTYETDLETSTGGLHGRGADTSNSVKMSSSHLTKNEYEALCEIVSSPIVYHITQDAKKFEVTPFDFSDSYDIDTTTYQIELAINLQDTNSQKRK